MFNDLIYIDPFTMIVTLLNFGVLFLILKHFLYKPIKKMLDARQTEVEQIYNDANTKNEAATSLKVDYEKKLSVAKETAGEIVKTATIKAQARGDDIIGEAQEKAEALLNRAQTQIEVDRKKAVNEIKDEIADMAIDAAKHVVGKDLNSNDQKKLVEDFIANVTM